MGFIYLLSLLAGIACMLLLDRRFRLFFWRDARSATVVTLVGLAVFLIWDLAGIRLLRGEGQIATGVLLAPELPIEEPIFLTFLVLCTMIIFTGLQRMHERHKARRSS